MGKKKKSTVAVGVLEVTRSLAMGIEVSTVVVRVPINVTKALAMSPMGSGLWQQRDSEGNQSSGKVAGNSCRSSDNGDRILAVVIGEGEFLAAIS